MIEKKIIEIRCSIGTLWNCHTSKVTAPEKIHLEKKTVATGLCDASLSLENMTFSIISVN